MSDTQQGEMTIDGSEVGSVEEVLGQEPLQAEAPEPEAPPVVVHQLQFDETGVIISTMQSNILSEGFIEVTPGIFAQAAPLIGRARLIDGEIVPMPAPPPPPITLSAETLFFDRMTPDEYDDLDASIAGNERASTVRGWRNANSFTEGTDMWALLVKYLTPDPSSSQRWTGVSDARRAELLARP